MAGPFRFCQSRHGLAFSVISMRQNVLVTSATKILPSLETLDCVPKMAFAWVRQQVTDATVNLSHNRARKGLALSTKEIGTHSKK